MVVPPLQKQGQGRQGSAVTGERINKPQRQMENNSPAVWIVNIQTPLLLSLTNGLVAAVPTWTAQLLVNGGL